MRCMMPVRMHLLFASLLLRSLRGRQADCGQEQSVTF